MLRGLGHTVDQVDPDHRQVFPSFVVRYGRGAHTDLVRLVDPQATELERDRQPAMAVPAGHTDDGLPLGVQLVGRPGEEDLLLALAGQLEQATSFSDRRPPLPL